MAFEAAQKISIVKALGISLDELDVHLTYRGASITTDIQTAVLEEVRAFNRIPNDGVEIFPNEANYGTRIQRGGLRDERIRNIRNLLGFNGFSYGQTRLVRS